MQDALKAEFANLRDGFITCERTWGRIGVFQKVEESIRIMLRLTDGHEPNLAPLKYTFDDTRRRSLEAANTAIDYPDLYVNLPAIVADQFTRREIDIVTPLALAAAMVYPSNVYTASDDIPVFSPRGGHEAILAVIQKYYPENNDPDLDESGNQACALHEYNLFRRREGPYFGAKVAIRTLRQFGPDAFWESAAVFHPIGSELFRKLTNGFAGQGESERLNKAVGRVRSINRNRQHHEVTCAWVELGNFYHTEEKSKKLR